MREGGRSAAGGVGLNMKSETAGKKGSILKKRRACWGKTVKGNQAESGGGGWEDCLLRGSGGGVRMGILESGQGSFATHRRSCSRCFGVIIAIAIF